MFFATANKCNRVILFLYDVLLLYDVLVKDLKIFIAAAVNEFCNALVCVGGVTISEFL